MILIADDDSAIRLSLSLLLKQAGYETVDFAQPDGLLDFVRHTQPDAILLDMNFTRETSGDEGLKVLRQIRLFRYPNVSQHSVIATRCRLVIRTGVII